MSSFERTATSANLRLLPYWTGSLVGPAGRRLVTADSHSCYHS